jgi:hypothetical protein
MGGPPGAHEETEPESAPWEDDRRDPLGRSPSDDHAGTVSVCGNDYADINFSRCAFAGELHLMVLQQPKLRLHF